MRAADDQEGLAELLPRSHSFEAGDLVKVTLTLKVSHTGHYIVVNDPIPAGLEVVDPSLKGAAVGQAAFVGHTGRLWRDFQHVELRDDRVLLFADRLKRGTYTFSYVARATQAGRFVRAAATVEEMYQPQRAGRADGGLLWIRPRRE